MFFIRRGIEAVITGLTRNQFVPKAHEGSNPSLCANKRGLLDGSPFFDASGGDETSFAKRNEEFAYRRIRRYLAFAWEYLPTSI